MCYTGFDDAGENELADKGEKTAFSSFFCLKLIAKCVPVYCKNAEVNIKVAHIRTPMYLIHISSYFIFK